MRGYTRNAVAALGLILAPGCTAGDWAGNSPDSPVLDRAELIPAEIEARMFEELSEYSRQTGRALVVATIPSLNGESIESYSTAMFNRLGNGDRKTNQGLLLLVAPTERKVRIEVGRGLETTVTNAIAENILKQAILPRFASGDMVGGIEEGIDVLTATTECKLGQGVSSYCTVKAAK